MMGASCHVAKSQRSFWSPAKAGNAEDAVDPLPSYEQKCVWQQQKPKKIKSLYKFLKTQRKIKTTTKPLKPVI